METENIPGSRTIAAVSLFWTTALGGSSLIATLTAASLAGAAGFAILGVLFLAAGVAFARFVVLKLIGPAGEMELPMRRPQQREIEGSNE